MSSFTADRSYALQCDAGDPLGSFRERFVIDDPSLIYLDGNSLGRLPLATAERIAEVVRREWGTGLVRSWAQWIGLPGRAWDLLGNCLLGAAPGQVLVCDSTTVNLYKLARAGLGARPGRRVIVTDDDNFPTDRYVLAGIAAERGAELRMIHTDMDSGVTADAVRAAVDGETALVSLSHVAYRSGALAGDAGQHVPVGGEVVVVGDDDGAAGPGVQGGAGQLVEVDRGAVADQHLAGRRAQQVLPEQVAHLAR